MAGFICKPEVEANREFIVQAYGVEFYVACLQADGGTFLSLLVKFKEDLSLTNEIPGRRSAM